AIAKQEAGVTGKRAKMTKEQLEALEMLEKQHEINIDKIQEEKRKKREANEKEAAKVIYEQAKKAFDAQIQAREAQAEAEKLAAAQSSQTQKEYADKSKKIDADLLAARIEFTEDYIALMDSMPDKTKEQIAELEKLRTALQKLKLEQATNNLTDEPKSKKKKAWEDKTGLEKVQAYVSAVGDMVSKTQDMINGLEQSANLEIEAQFNRRYAALNDYYKKGLISEGQYNKEKDKLDKEKAKKELAVKKKYANLQMTMTLASIAADTAKGIMGIWAEWSELPIVAGIMTGLLGTVAAIQTGVAIKQRNAIMALSADGLEEGGRFNVRREQDGKVFDAEYVPDKRGIIDKPTILAGENGAEQVIPNDGLMNPNIRPVLDGLELARRRGRLRQIKIEEIFPAYRMQGREGGGYFNGKYLPNYADNPLANAMRERANEDNSLLTSLLQKLDARLDGGIIAQTYVTGKGSIGEAMTLQERMKRNVSRKL
ncbi:MAG: hypothetical protein LBN27_02155, partial [Prevotellaceae bacterium]|nr:hypothetical protein [Prevotellaceae bacterium]